MSSLYSCLNNTASGSDNNKEVGGYVAAGEGSKHTPQKDDQVGKETFKGREEGAGLYKQEGDPVKGVARPFFSPPASTSTQMKMMAAQLRSKKKSVKAAAAVAAKVSSSSTTATSTTPSTVTFINSNKNTNPYTRNAVNSVKEGATLDSSSTTTTTPLNTGASSTASASSAAANFQLYEDEYNPSRPNDYRACEERRQGLVKTRKETLIRERYREEEKKERRLRRRRWRKAKGGGAEEGEEESHYYKSLEDIEREVGMECEDACYGFSSEEENKKRKRKNSASATSSSSSSGSESDSNSNTSSSSDSEAETYSHKDKKPAAPSSKAPPPPSSSSTSHHHHHRHKNTTHPHPHPPQRPPTIPAPLHHESHRLAGDPRGDLERVPSKVVLLKNMIQLPADQQELTELEQEVREECEAKYGPIHQIKVFVTPPVQQSNSTAVVLRCKEDQVRIFVKFTSKNAAVKAVRDLNGRYFGGLQVIAGFFNEVRFERGILAR
eukprot:Nk52_evm5s159 gene=Nk52_evmTU5s159